MWRIRKRKGSSNRYKKGAVIDIKKEGASLVYDASSSFLVFVLFYDMQLVTPREAAIAVKIDITI